MGTGWSYFINVCQAARIAIGAAWSVVGLIAVYLFITIGLPKLQSALPSSPAPAASTVPTGTQSNPQFAAPPVVVSPRASAPRGVPGANPQFVSPNASPTPPVSAPGMNSQPTNPQFAPSAPRLRANGGGSGGQPNAQFKNPQFGH